MKDIPLDNKIEQLDDILNHIGYVVKAGHILCKKLLLSGEEDLAIGLLQRILNHDSSKSAIDEFYGMAKYSNDLESLKDVNVKQVKNEEKMTAIKLHWSRNDHHPEYWTDTMPDSLTGTEPLVISSDMSKLSIAEMCCDLYARSLQFNSNVVEFYLSNQNSRWIFNKKQNDLILKFLLMLSEDE